MNKRKLIPGTNNFFADHTGIITDELGKVRNTYRNGDGYITCSINTIEYGWRTFGVHRLVLLTFDYVENNKTLTVNHIDGDKTNNYFDNLEWVTNKENIIHFNLTKNTVNDNIKVIYPFGEEFSCNNLSEAVELTGFEPSVIWWAIKNKLDIYGVVFEHVPRNVNSRKIFDCTLPINKRPLKAKSLLSGEIMTFSGNSEASKYFNISRSLLASTMSDKNTFRLVKKEWEVISLNEPFREITDTELKKVLDRGPKEVLAKQKDEIEFSTYPSASNFIKETGLSKKAVTTRLKKGILAEYGYYEFIYKNI